MNKYKKLFFIIFFILVLVLVVIFSFMESRKKSQIVTPPQAKISLLSSQMNIQGLFPTETIIFPFSDSPELFHCIAQTKDLSPSFFRSSYKEHTLLLSSDQSWPPGKTISFAVTCDEYETTIDLTIKKEADLSQDQQFQVETKDQKWVVDQRASYLKDTPFVSSFPLKRSTYTIFYAEVQNVLYVSPNTGTISSDQQQQIIAKERPLVKALGVPDSIPFVFSIPK